METWVKKVQKSINSDDLTVVKSTGDMLLMAGTAEEEEEGHKGHSHEYDPHVWLSPKRAVTLVENIRDAFVAKYPDKAETFKTNSAAYIEKLNDLDKKYSDALSNAKQKSFVTQHAAFGYLALDYGLNQIPITGVSAESEPSAKRLASLTKYVKKYDIKYIYFEENASSKVAATLADEAGVKTAVLNPLESLTTKEIKAGEDYFTVMKDNLKALQLTTDVQEHGNLFTHICLMGHLMRFGNTRQMPQKVNKQPKKSKIITQLVTKLMLKKSLLTVRKTLLHSFKTVKNISTLTNM